MSDLLAGWGYSVITFPDNGSGFTIPSPPATSTATKVALSPEFTAGPTGLDPYRPWSVTVLDGLTYVANGFDQPKRWDGSTTFYNLGSTAPTTFAAATTPGTIFPDGTTNVYYLVFRNSTTGKETAPQQTSGAPGVSVTNSSGSAKDFLITWTDPGGEYDTARIYRQLQNSDAVKFLDDVTASVETYTDVHVEITLLAGEAYVDTFRTTLPPKFDWLRAYQGRLFGGFRDSATVYYAQAVRIDDELRAEDFPSGWILQPGSEDGSGGVITMLPHYASAYFFKRRACFELAGDLSLGTQSIRKMSADRGCISEDCIVELDGSALVLDERGLYWWTPAGEPLVAGAVTGTRESPIQSTWDRMNLGVAHKFFMVHDRENRIVRVFVALDFEPVPNVAAVFDYGENRFVSIDSLCHGMAAGELRDATDSALHIVRTGDMGYAWEEEYAESQGVFAGDNTATLTAASQTALTASAASFDTTTADGTPGAPYERYDTDGTLLDQNRVAAATGTALTPFLFSTDTPAVDQTVAVGAIPAVVRIPRITLNTNDKKWVRCVTVDHDNGVNGNLRVESARDEESYALAREFSLLTNIHTLCKVSDRGWTWSVQFSQRYANLGFSVRGLHVDYVAVPGQRK